MVDDATDDGALDRARALASPTRARIHSLISESDHPLTVAELVGLTGLHRSVVRLHLRQLADAGLVQEFTMPPTGRGRPRFGYRAIDGDPYRTMAGWLAATMSSDVAIGVGRTVGASLALLDGDGVERIVDEAARRGFDPVLDDHGDGRVDVVLRACPFAEVAATSPAVVCGLHRGVMDGIAAATGGVVVEGLEVANPFDAGCRIRLRRTPPTKAVATVQR